MTYLTSILRLALGWFKGRDSMFAYRRDWTECCHDSDEAHRILDAMRRECGHGRW
jgi:hypothetical protein